MLPMFGPDLAAGLGLAEARGFDKIWAWDGGKPIASSLPFCLAYADDGSPRVAFHVARNNPLAKLADGETPWLMTVNGADAYVSADWYASPDQVPTWFYQAVHLTGCVQVLPDHELGQHLEMLAAKFEGCLAPNPPWTTSKRPPGRPDAINTPSLR